MENSLFEIIENKPIGYCSFEIPAGLNQSQFEALGTIEDILADIRVLSAAIVAPDTSIHAAIVTQKKKNSLCMSCDDVIHLLAEAGLCAEFKLITLECSEVSVEVDEFETSPQQLGLKVTISLQEMSHAA